MVAPGLPPYGGTQFDGRKDLLTRLEILENEVRRIRSLINNDQHELEVAPNEPLTEKKHFIAEDVPEARYLRTNGKQAASFSEIPADEVVVDASAFSGNLSVTDTDVQKALDTIDGLSIGSGDVTGPASSVDNNIATYNGLTGKVIKDSGVSSTSLHNQNTDTGTTSNTFTVDSDSNTGKIVLDVALGAADKSLTLTNIALTDNRTITFPDNTGTVALTSDIPSSFDNISEGNSKVEVIDAGTGYVSIYIDGAEKYRLDASGIADTSGNEILKFAFNASAVNEIAVANAATTSKPKISTEGGDTDIGLEIATKGAGQLDVIIGATQRFYVGATEAGTNSADINIDGVLKIGATQVLTNQQAAIADIDNTSGPANDGTARAMCNTILALLRTHGIIAT